LAATVVRVDDLSAAVENLGKNGVQNVETVVEKTQCFQWEMLRIAVSRRPHQDETTGRHAGQHLIEQCLVCKVAADPIFRLAATCARASSNDREQPAPPQRRRPAPHLPSMRAAAERKKDDLGSTDDVLERHIADPTAQRRNQRLTRIGRGPSSLSM
jgi:hypothetical protein